MRNETRPVFLTTDELAAATGLTEPRLNARVAMAEQYDPMYAQGLADGYLNASTVLALLALEGRL